VHQGGRDRCWLPARAEAAVVTEAWGRRKVFAVRPAVERGVREVVLDWGGERPARVRFGTVPECVVGYRIPGARAYVSDDNDEIVTWAGGHRTLRVLLSTGATHDLPLDLPPGGLLELERPGIAPVRRRPITVLEADGAPAELRSCRVFDAAPWLDARDDLTGVAGSWFRIVGARPERGFRAACYGRLEGPGPWTVRLGSAALRVTLAVEDDERGDPRPRCLYIDGEVFEVEGGAATEVVGLRAGPHLVLLGAGGHVGRAMRVVLREGETREIRVRLGRR
jgi:hypothetical protein